MEGDLIADFADLRKLHILTDKLQRLAHILKLNIRLGTNLKREMARIDASSPSACNVSFERVQAQLNDFLLGQEISKDRVETLIARSGKISQLVSLSLKLFTFYSDHDLYRCRVYRILDQRKQANISTTRCKD